MPAGSFTTSMAARYVAAATFSSVERELGEPGHVLHLGERLVDATS